jgi:hypothetical protein
LCKTYLAKNNNIKNIEKMRRIIPKRKHVVDLDKKGATIIRK